jgi:hypothetical protein
MQRRIIIMGTSLLFLTGCAAQAMGLLRGGENAKYGASNTTPREIEQVRVMNASNPNRWYFSQSGQPANTWKPSAEYPRRMPSFGGNHLNPHKIPEEVLITWREMPPSGGQPYTGELNGPYRVKVRERIPKEVLNAASKDGYLVELSFSAGELPIRFNWKLIDFVSLKHGTKDWCIGGDSFQDHSEKAIKPSNTYADPISVWPHCKLP